MSTVEYFLIKRPLNNDVFCGDTAIIKKFDNKIFISIIDVLGHGEQAQEIATLCDDFLETNYQKDLIEIITGLHEHIKGTRGAMAGLCSLDILTGKFAYTVVGNITLRKFGSNNKRVISNKGIVGYVMRTPKKESLKLSVGDVLLLYTDGVKEHFEIKDYPEILNDDAKTIATNIMDQFGKKQDDALCIAVKF